MPIPPVIFNKTTKLTNPILPSTSSTISTLVNGVHQSNGIEESSVKTDKIVKNIQNGDITNGEKIEASTTTGTTSTTTKKVIVKKIIKKSSNENKETTDVVDPTKNDIQPEIPVDSQNGEIKPKPKTKVIIKKVIKKVKTLDKDSLNGGSNDIKTVTSEKNSNDDIINKSDSITKQPSILRIDKNIKESSSTTLTNGFIKNDLPIEIKKDELSKTLPNNSSSVIETPQQSDEKSKYIKEKTSVTKRSSISSTDSKNTPLDKENVKHIVTDSNNNLKTKSNFETKKDELSKSVKDKPISVHEIGNKTEKVDEKNIILDEKKASVSKKSSVLSKYGIKNESASDLKDGLLGKEKVIKKTDKTDEITEKDQNKKTTIDPIENNKEESLKSTVIKKGYVVEKILENKSGLEDKINYTKEKTLSTKRSSVLSKYGLKNESEILIDSKNSLLDKNEEKIKKSSTTDSEVISKTTENQKTKNDLLVSEKKDVEPKSVKTKSILTVNKESKENLVTENIKEKSSVLEETKRSSVLSKYGLKKETEILIDSKNSFLDKKSLTTDSGKDLTYEKISKKSETLKEKCDLSASEKKDVESKSVEDKSISTVKKETTEKVKETTSVLDDKKRSSVLTKYGLKNETELLIDSKNSVFDKEKLKKTIATDRKNSTTEITNKISETLTTKGNLLTLDKKDEVLKSIKDKSISLVKNESVSITEKLKETSSLLDEGQNITKEKITRSSILSKYGNNNESSPSNNKSNTINKNTSIKIDNSKEAVKTDIKEIEKPDDILGKDLTSVISKVSEKLNQCKLNLLQNKTQSDTPTVDKSLEKVSSKTSISTTAEIKSKNQLMINSPTVALNNKSNSTASAIDVINKSSDEIGKKKTENKSNDNGKDLNLTKPKINIPSISDGKTKVDKINEKESKNIVEEIKSQSISKQSPNIELDQISKVSKDAKEKSENNKKPSSKESSVEKSLSLNEKISKDDSISSSISESSLSSVIENGRVKTKNARTGILEKLGELKAFKSITGVFDKSDKVEISELNSNKKLNEEIRITVTDPPNKIQVDKNNNIDKTEEDEEKNILSPITKRPPRPLISARKSLTSQLDEIGTSKVAPVLQRKVSVPTMKTNSTDKVKPVEGCLKLPLSRSNSVNSEISFLNSRESSIISSRSPSPISSRSSLSSYTNRTRSRTSCASPRRMFPQVYSDESSLNINELNSLEQSPVIFDANMQFVLGCKKQSVHQRMTPIPAHSDPQTASSYLSDKISAFLKRTDHVMEEWKSVGGKNVRDDDTMSLIEQQKEKNRKSGVGPRSRSVTNILMKSYQIEQKLPPTERANSVSRCGSFTRDMNDSDTTTLDDRTILDEDFDELSEITVDLAEEHSASNLTTERLEAETAERFKLEKELQEQREKIKNLQETSEKLEMELICAKSDLNGMSEDEEGENDENGGIYKLKYERVARELEFTKKRLQTQHEHDLEQLVGLKKQLEKKLNDAYEEVEEQRQVVGQWKRKSQKMINEMNDLRMLLEEQNSRNNLLEKKQRKFDSECQNLQDSIRQEKQAKDRLAREKDVLIAEKFQLDQQLADTRLELDLKEEKLASLQREMEEMTFNGGTEEEVAQLKRQKMELERRVKEHEEELDEMAGQVQMLEQAKLRLEMSLETMRKDARREAQQRDEELEEIRGSSYKKIKNLECHLETEHEERTLLVREKHELERRLSMIEEQYRSDHAAEESVIQKLKRDLRKYKALLRDSQNQLERLKVDTPGKGLIRQLRNQLEDAEATRISALKSKQTAEAELSDMQAMYEEAVRARNDAEDRATSALRDRSELQAQIEENEEEMAELMKKYSASVKQLNTEHIAASEYELKLSELEAERNSLKEQIAELQTRLENVESMADPVTNAHSKRLELRCRELESRLELEQATKARIEVQCNRHKDSLEKLQQDYAQLKGKEYQINETLKKSQKSLRDLREEFHVISSREQESITRRKDLEKKIETSEAEITSLRNDLRLALQRIADLQQAMEDGDTEPTESENDTDSSDESFNSESSLTNEIKRKSILAPSKLKTIKETNGLSPSPEKVITKDAKSEDSPRITVTIPGNGNNGHVNGDTSFA